MSHGVVLGSVFVVHLLAMLSPGPNVLVVTQAAASRTRRAGVLVALGVATGAAIWSAAALLGLNLLFNRVAGLYAVLALVGGFYLLYLAHRLWRGARQPLTFPSGGRATARTDGQAFRLGLLTNLTNPKALVFYGSVFAALLGPGLPAWVELAAFAIIVVNSTLWHTLLACLFATRGTQQAYQRAKVWIDRLAAIALALLGLRLVLPGLPGLPALPGMPTPTACFG
jgi:threonine efflux protein